MEQNNTEEKFSYDNFFFNRDGKQDLKQFYTRPQVFENKNGIITFGGEYGLYSDRILTLIKFDKNKVLFRSICELNINQIGTNINKEYRYNLNKRGEIILGAYRNNNKTPFGCFNTIKPDFEKVLQYSEHIQKIFTSITDIPKELVNHPVIRRLQSRNLQNRISTSLADENIGPFSIDEIPFELE